MIERVVVATLWNGPLVVRELAPDDPDPTVAQLDAVAAALTAGNDGVRPTVRVLERTPAFHR